MCAQILRCSKSKYLLFFSVHRFFRHAGIDVNYGTVQDDSTVCHGTMCLDIM